MTKSLERTILISTGAPTGRGAVTRQRIIEATIEVIAERGWAAVTTREVARRAGVQQAQIGYHFGSKDALLRAAIMTAFDLMASGFMEMLAADPGEPLDVGPLIGAMDVADEDARLTLVGAEALSLALRDPELGAWMRGELRHLRGVLAERLTSVVRTGDAREGPDPEGTAVLLIALLDGLLLHRAFDPTLDLARAADALHALLTPGATPTQRSDP